MFKSSASIAPRAAVLAAVLLISSACARMGEAPAAFIPEPAAYQAISRLGDTLRNFPLSEAARTRYLAQLDTAEQAYRHTPVNMDSLIWYGRRLGYLGRLQEAIAVYSHGLTTEPDNAWLLRHRGHRYLSVREFDKAVADFTRADSLTAGKPDEVEPDGQPNAQNTPIGTLQSNIRYHLALGHYLRGDYDKAAEVAQGEVTNANNDDRRVSMTHWLYQSLRRAGKHEEAKKALDGVSANMQIIENTNYHKLVQLYKGLLPVDSVLPPATNGELSVGDVSSAYGVAAWMQAEGKTAEATELMKRIVASGQWGAFGFIAAEADLARASKQ
ncbi:MAG: hypothetical protein IBJ03_13800 [Gemmatimonadaceae bacterium]|nr:hypothetical protein [Gemmatimonadaceae bacterium]